MQQLDAITLKALAGELQGLLDGAKVSKVQQPSAHEFLVTIWGGASRPGSLNLVYIHVNPEAPFVVLCDSKERQRTALRQFEKPTALCMLLRKHLNGASVLAVRTHPAERVLDLVFENFNELGNKVRLVLSVELMGKHSNMILYDEVQGVILAVAHGVSEQMSSHRELAPGLPYAAPPRPSGKRLLSEITSREFADLWQNKPADEDGAIYLNKHLAGFGQRMLAGALALTKAPLEIYRHLTALENGENLTPAISPDGERFTLLAPTASSAQTAGSVLADGSVTTNHWRRFEEDIAPVNAMAGNYFLSHVRESRMGRKRQQLQQLIDQHEKKLKKREKELVPISDDEIEALQNTGDRILAALSSNELPAPSPQKSMVSLTHYDSGAPWEIEIDPSQSWVENAQLYYRRARKAKARKEIYEQSKGDLHAELGYLSDLRILIDQAESLAELEALEAEMTAAGIGKKAPPEAKGKSRKKGPGKNDEPAPTGVVSLRSSDGLEILVGKSGQGNDAIVGKLSRPDDLWLHVHQMPGSHVLIRSGRETIPDQTMLEAATLAVWYSSARLSKNVPVIYTQSKFVRKIPQSYPGHVNYREEQTVFITPNPVLVDQLFSS